MDKAITIVVIVVILAVVFFSWWRSWKKRQGRQVALTPPPPPAELGAARSEHRVLYLATTIADQPLERVAIAGLGFRSEAVLGIHDAGIVLTLSGRRDPLFIPTGRIVGAGRANWTIDRASGGNRLVFLRWRISDGSDTVDTNLRAADTTALVTALDEFLPAPADNPKAVR